ncbi:hypothetical protein Tco_0314931 [Tanacetum coccineum]
MVSSRFSSREFSSAESSRIESISLIGSWYGYCKNLKKTVKTEQSRTREWKRVQELGECYQGQQNSNLGQQKSTTK